MSDTNEKQSTDKPKSSRRRRWEVKSKESFETSLAVEVESSDKHENKKHSKSTINKKERPKSSQINSSYKRKSKDILEIQSNGSNTDIVSAKLTVLLNDAAQISKENECQSLRDSEESLIKSELKNYLEVNPNMSEPSAPPMSPSLSEEANETPDKKIPLKRKPTHLGVVINSKITQQLNQLKEDIVEGKEMNKELATFPAFTISGLMIGPSSSSSTLKGNISTIYCERLNNFIITSHDHLIDPKKNEPLRDIRRKETKKLYALFLQTGFRTFSILCQGLLAGIMIAHCLLIFLLEEVNHILLMKHSLEHVFFSLIFFLSCICLVSSLDRYDVAGQGVFTEHGLRIPWTPLLYLVSFIVTVITIRAEDFITHFNVYSGNIQSKKNDLLMWWKFMCLGRTSFAVLAWVTLVADPHTDALNARVQELMEE